MWVKKQQLEPYMEKFTGSEFRKEYDKAIYCHLVNLTYMQNTSCETPDCMSYMLESRLLEEISRTSDMQTEKAMAPYSSTLAWQIPWMEEAGRLQSLGSLGVRHDFTEDEFIALLR